MIQIIFSGVIKENRLHISNDQKYPIKTSVHVQSMAMFYEVSVAFGYSKNA